VAKKEMSREVERSELGKNTGRILGRRREVERYEFGKNMGRILRKESEIVIQSTAWYNSSKSIYSDTNELLSWFNS